MRIFAGLRQQLDAERKVSAAAVSNAKVLRALLLAAGGSAAPQEVTQPFTMLQGKSRGMKLGCSKQLTGVQLVWQCSPVHADQWWQLVKPMSRAMVSNSAMALTGNSESKQRLPDVAMQAAALRVQAALGPWRRLQHIPKPLKHPAAKQQRRQCFIGRLLPASVSRS